MHIGHSNIGATLILAGSVTAGRQWQAGQTLNATVIEAESDGRLLLQLEGQGKPVEARSPLPLAPGQQVKLMVAIEASRIVLRLLDAEVEQPAMQQAWRSALPRQMPLASVLHSIARLLQLPPPPTGPHTHHPSATGTPPASPLSAAGQPPPLPDNRPPGDVARPQPITATAASTQAPDKLPALAEQLLGRIGDPQRLATADGLRQALLNSGLFLEGRLARGDISAVQDDFRAGLLRLLGAVREQTAIATAPGASRGGSTPPGPQLPASMLLELSQQIEGALARVRVQQLHTLGSQSGPDPAWLLELPLRHGAEIDILRLRIQREDGNRNSNAATGWSVRLHFDSPRHGSVDSVVTLLGGKIGVSFWADQPQTAERVQLHLEELRGQLQHAGLEVEHLRSTTGRAASTDEPIPGGLLNLSV